MTISKVEKSRKKTGGRKKGTPNKKTLQLTETLGAFEPVEKLKEIYNLTQDYSIKAKICLDLLKYLYPQRKAIEFDTENIQLPEINIKGI